MITIHNWTTLLLLLLLFLISSSSSFIFFDFYFISHDCWDTISIDVCVCCLHASSMRFGLKYSLYLSIFVFLALFFYFFLLFLPRPVFVWPPMILRINLFYYSAILYYYHYFIVLIWWLLLLCFYDYYCVFQFIFFFSWERNIPLLNLNAPLTELKTHQFSSVIRH